jgi:3-dehydroquinate dehydratase
MSHPRLAEVQHQYEYTNTLPVNSVLSQTFLLVNQFHRAGYANKAIVLQDPAWSPGQVPLSGTIIHQKMPTVAMHYDNDARPPNTTLRDASVVPFHPQLPSHLLFYHF